VCESSEMVSYGESLSSTTAPERRGAEEEKVLVERRRAPRGPTPTTTGRGRRGVVHARKLAVGSSERRGAPLPVPPPPRAAGRGRSVTPKKRTVAAAEERGGPPRRDPREGPSVRRSATPERRSSDAVCRRKAIDNIVSNSPAGAAVSREAESLEDPVVSLECFIFL
ncbi:hypothetical protein M569_05752, partial [Genlisea aurea]